ncbi:hypothetical protein [Aquariibacter albus]|uniref:Uncharacterized protein n=1 Tax=Aquariibacter albus TaxID=2759899 RepID=A0A839HFT1_9BURK|nr:hypothetical protein [Aquariibacter albus]MBB1160967.1 hypothetical protein [Aquariibacter albus]
MRPYTYAEARARLVATVRRQLDLAKDAAERAKDAPERATDRDRLEDLAAALLGLADDLEGWGTGKPAKSPSASERKQIKARDDAAWAAFDDPASLAPTMPPAWQPKVRLSMQGAAELLSTAHDARHGAGATLHVVHALHDLAESATAAAAACRGPGPRLAPFDLAALGVLALFALYPDELPGKVTNYVDGPACTLLAELAKEAGLPRGPEACLKAIQRARKRVDPHDLHPLLAECFGLV